MPEVKRILCPVDFSEFSVKAYRYAVSLSRHYHAELFVQHIVELWQYPCADFAPSPAAFDNFCRIHREKAEEKLRELAKDEAAVDIQSEYVIQQGMAPDLILAFAESQKPDVIVMGTHGRRGFDRLMLGSVTEHVMRKASCPVLAVRRPSHDFIVSAGGQNSVYLNRILFCSDFSENSQRALDHAISLAAEYRAELTLLHVLEDIPISAKFECIEADAIRRLDRMIPVGDLGTSRVKTLVRVGKAYEQIVRFAAEAQTDIIVMAVRGRSAMDLAIFGSTTHRVLQLGYCPVLVVHV